jgi:cytochrome c oxidase subunit 2
VKGSTVALLLIAAAIGLTACSAEYPQSSLHPTADFSRDIDTLYRTIFWWALGVFVVVETALLVVVVRYRDRPGAGEPRQIHGSTALEVAWTLAPAVVLVFIAVPTIRTIFRTDGAPPPGALEVEVVGKQWWWAFSYPEYGITTANELHVPQGRPIALTMTSDDVIHSFWVPKLGGKRDVMPGRTTRIAFTADSVGEVYGQCAEFCGDSHANMRFRVVVDAASDFDRWVEHRGSVARRAGTESDAPRVTRDHRRGHPAQRRRRAGSLATGSAGGETGEPDAQDPPHRGRDRGAGRVSPEPELARITRWQPRL